MFLRLFPAYRELEKRADRADAMVQHLQDQIVRLDDRLAAEVEAYRALSADTIKSTRDTVDFLANSRFGHAMFDRAQAIPDVAAMEPIRNTRPQASALVAEAWQEFNEQRQKEEAQQRKLLEEMEREFLNA